MLGRGDQVDGRVAGEQIKEGAEDGLVAFDVEVLGREDVDEGGKNLGVQKDPPQNRLFGFLVLGG